MCLACPWHERAGACCNKRLRVHAGVGGHAPIADQGAGADDRRRPGSRGTGRLYGRPGRPGTGADAEGRGRARVALEGGSCTGADGGRPGRSGQKRPTYRRGRDALTRDDAKRCDQGANPRATRATTRPRARRRPATCRGSTQRRRSGVSPCRADLPRQDRQQRRGDVARRATGTGAPAPMGRTVRHVNGRLSQPSGDVERAPRRAPVHDPAGVREQPAPQPLPPRVEDDHGRRRRGDLGQADRRGRVRQERRERHDRFGAHTATAAPVRRGRSNLSSEGPSS